MNVYLILLESGAIADGQDLRETELFQRSLKLGLISNRESESGSSPNPTPSTRHSQELLLHLSGMWCTSCAWLIEHALSELPGIEQAEASFASDTLKVIYEPQKLPRERIFQCVESLGYKAQQFSADRESWNAETRDLLIRTGISAFLWVNIMSFSLVLYAGYFEQISGSIRRGLPFVLMALATPIVFYCALPILRLAWRGLVNGAIRMELLLALGILAAYFYSVIQSIRGEIHLYFDTATAIVTLVLAGKLIERSAKEKASHWITQLHRMLPNKVRLMTKGSERFVNIEALEAGQILLVKAGERIPADGIVIEGETHVDESLLTGESTPIGRCAGDEVAAGSINLDGVLHVRALRTASDSTLCQIISMVEKALGSHCELERTADRIARIFVPAVVLLAGLTFGLTFLTGSETIGHALMRGITVLVIACPCALGMATPLAITAALGCASQNGILVRDSRVLETLRKIDTLVLDKTGTVTEGRFSLLDFSMDCKQMDREVVMAGLYEEQAFSDPPYLREHSDHASAEALSLFVSLEQYSEHPIGRAVVDYARGRGALIQNATQVEIRKGLGITALIGDQCVFAGNRRLLEALRVSLPDDLDRHARAWEMQGKTVAFFGWDGETKALAAFGDCLKADASGLVSQLKGMGITVQLISGDAPATTNWAAAQLGIGSPQSAVLPEDKVASIRSLQQQGAIVAMVGDGVNDAPALAQADLGIALGSGTDIAMKAAAVVLVNGSLGRITDVLALSKKTFRIVRQNLFWAFLYNVIGISLAVAGILNPIMAAFAMLLSSLSVVGNSMRLSRRAI